MLDFRTPSTRPEHRKLPTPRADHQSAIARALAGWRGKTDFMEASANSAVRERLLELQRVDQEHARAVYEASQRQPGHAGRFIFDIPRSEWLPEYWAALALIPESVKALGEILDSIGWPGISQVGEEAAAAAWVIAQHAGEADAAFQQRCLALLAERVREGDANPAHLAALADRVELHAGRPQLYGTHLETDGSGGFRAVRGIDDPEALDERRAAIGLKPWNEYLAACLAGDPEA